MRATDRIPGFAICARCGARRRLGPCSSCGILVCGDCRLDRDCAVCQAERLAAVQKAERRRRLRELGRRAAVVSLVAASGITGLSAAFIPAGPMCAGALAPVALEFRSASEMGISAPVPLETAASPWTEQLTFRCFQARSDLTCCVVEAP